MKIVEDMEQGSHLWHEWRRNKITATDAAVCMGLMPFGKTPLKLWTEKLSGKASFKPNEAMRRGQQLEPIARQEFTKLTGIDVAPTVIESASIPWAGASLDGLSNDRQRIVEIKVHNAEMYEKVKNGLLTEYINAQTQHQMMCAEVDWMYYFAFDGEKGLCIKLYRDEEFIKKMFRVEQEFWDCLQNLKAPPEVYGEYEVIDDEESSDLMAKYLDLREKISEDSLKLDEMKLNLLEKAQNRNVIAGIGKMTKVFRKGSIDYAQIPEIKGMDLEQYRKKPSEYYLIKEI